MFSLIGVSLLGATVLSTASAQGTLSIQLASSPPVGTSKVVDPSFAGFGIEPSNLFSFAGYSTANQLTMNLLNNLVNYTGYPAHIRLGGNTQDYMIYDETMTQWTYITNPNSVGQGAVASDSMLIGPRFYEAANRFPKGTPITYGLNLAYSQSDYITQIATTANLAITKLTNLKVVSFEIGNEPDLYLANGFRTGTWNGQVYTQEWLTRAQALYAQVLKPQGLPSNFFESGQTASTIGTSFMINDLSTYGMTEQANGSSSSYLYSWNQHDYYYYIGVSTYALTLDHFLTLSTTADQFAAWVTQIGQAAVTGYPYALREMGVVGPIGLDGITNVFGAALWQLNFLLYAATLNISMVGMHMTDNSNASAWSPLNMYGIVPHVRPNYYGVVAFDQVIGPSCQARVSAYEISEYPTGYDGRITAYSVYQGDTISSVVIINGMLANVSDNKNSVTVKISFPTSFAGQDLYLAYLTNTGADAYFNTTWNGMSFEQSGNGKSTSISDKGRKTTIGSDGSASVTLRDTQAVVAQIGTPVGKITANTSACAALKPNTTSSSTSTTTSSAASKSSGASQSSTSTTSGVAGLASRLACAAASSIVIIIFLYWS